jgi:diadenosine tetraphosphate (Ap4A) HIT family hydrolase
MFRAESCPLCHEPGGEMLWQDELCRLVLVPDADYPGFCRVVWKRHAAEMTDLDAAQRRHLMSVVFAAETALRATARPDKINLASLGNQVPHLHWHVVPRWRDDRHFPNPVWSAATRESRPRAAANPEALRAAFVRAMAEEQGGE